ncbi:MAG: hypothetical protein QOK29_3440 [Rhodospirillaceae bacterium]|jgi:cytochrome c556|nr:hypothetical protein [Rhodospirillaceae bacterium]
MQRTTLAAVFAAAVIAAAGLSGIRALTGTALADNVQSTIDTRRALMKEMAGEMKAIYAAVDKKSGDMAEMEKRAEKIQADSAKIPTLFPAGSSLSDRPGKTNAKPDIWANSDTFKNAAANLGSQAGKLAAAAKSGDMAAFSAQFDATGANGCGGCHKQFRQKTD